VTTADPREISVRRDDVPRVGFFTDTTVCIGCKACEVACKQWNDLPADDSEFERGRSYDHTGALSASTWRHVRFLDLLEPTEERRTQAAEALASGAGGNAPSLPATHANGDGQVDVAEAVSAMDRWIFMSDVCKHCTNAGCMDACPTGALIRTEFQTVFLQPDVCNGCGYCVPACPFGVVDRDHIDGRAGKCTLCYDRLQDGLEPACAKACPTDSIQFGPLDELRERAAQRVEELHERGVPEARLYGHDPNDGVGGDGAFFLLLDEPEVYGLPPDPVVPTRDAGAMWKYAGMAASALVAATVSAFIGRGKP
jgi:formate dehydrogenase iron-sulfur subunit